MNHFHSIAAVLAYIGSLSYGGIFLLIIASGHLIPVPESVTLILLGYLSALGERSIWGVAAVAILATLAIDVVVYGICLGGSELAMHLTKRVRGSLLERYKGAEERHLFGLVFASHFVPGWRFANPVIAGMTQMPWKKFGLYSIIASCVYAPIYVFTGFFFHSRVLSIVAAIQSVQHIVLYVLVLGVVAFIIVYNTRNAKK